MSALKFRRGFGRGNVNRRKLSSFADDYQMGTYGN